MFYISNMPKVDDNYKENRKNQILEAAYRCFSEKGYRDTSMRDILKESKLSAGAVYNYFKSKAEIVRGLVKSGEVSMDIVSEPDKRMFPSEILNEYLSSLGKKESAMSMRTDISIWDAALNDPKLMELVKESFKSRTAFLKNTMDYPKNDSEEFDLGALPEIMISLILGASIQNMVSEDFDAKAYQNLASSLLDALNRQQGT